MTLTPISLEELASMQIPPKEWIVEDLIAEGAAVILTAREKAGKGLLCWDLLCSLASEEPFLGRAVKPGPVVYIALEESARVLKERALHRTAKKTDLPIYVVLADGTTEDSFAVESEEGIQSLLELITTVQPVCIVIDTLRESHSGREDSSDDMAPRLRPIRQIAHQTGTTIVVTHHQSKMMGASRGSTAIRASFDDEIAFTRTDEESSPEIAGRLKVEGRNVIKQAIHVVFGADTGKWALANDPEIIDVSLRGRILRVLEDANAWVTAKQIAERLHPVKLKTIQNEMSRMTKEGVVPKTGGNSKVDPSRYTIWQQHLDVFPEGSGNNHGNDGNHDWRAA